MITRLHISNYALIRDLTLTPAADLNIITGGTGAGKSIMLGALSLLLGKRADIKSVGHPDQKSVVEASFSVPDDISEAVRHSLKDVEPTIEQTDHLTLRRELHPSGRSRAFINDTPVQLATLAMVAQLLVDIHSQHRNQDLTDADFQRDVIDIIAKNAPLLEKYQQTYAKYRQALKTYSTARDEIEQTRLDVDYLEYQLSELDRLGLKKDEEQELEAQRESLSHSADISKLLSEAATVLTYQDGNAIDLISQATSALHTLTAISGQYAPLFERMQALSVEIEDIAASINYDAQSLRDEPAELANIEDRLDKINALKAKHRLAEGNQLVELRENLANRLAKLADADAELKEYETRARQLKKQAVKEATELSARRKTAASALIDLLTDRARPLGMENLVFEVAVESGKLNPYGCDTVEFRFAFNKNQTPAAVSGKASGGEISRIMLVLKSILAEYKHLPTIIFDEIDTGVSGDIAMRMGRLMEQMARHLQVMVITHLPQVAARGDMHFKVEKHDVDDSTVTTISPLDPDSRIAEIALMLSGAINESTSMATAKKLLYGTN